MTHTSGLANLPRACNTSLADLSDPFAKYTTEYFDEKVVPVLAKRHRGSVGAFNCSHLGCAVLTRLLEVFTGHDWWTLASTHVFTPLTIKDASINPAPECVPVLRAWTGAIRKQWTDSEPFVGAGGLHSTFDALGQYAMAVAQRSRGVEPRGWVSSRTLRWHNGHNRDHGAFAGFSHDGSRIVTVHTLGFNAGRSNKTATTLERCHPLA